MNNSETTLFVNARLIDPATGYDGPGSVLLADGKISKLDKTGKLEAPKGAKKIDCKGHCLSPGLVDMRVFTGEPGAEHRETLATASLAAAAGGVTTFICMPNTDPVIDDVSLVDFITRRARDTAIVNIHPMAALTKGLNGEEMTEIGLLKEAGALAFTDPVKAVENAVVMRRALSYAKFFNALIVQHAEEPMLAMGGVMNEGELATRLGLAGIPNEAEMIMIERDLNLVELTGGRYHIAQISCAQSVEIVRRAKQKGLHVTCGVSAAHLTLNENDIGEYRTFFKLSPPLRHEQDREALVRGVRDRVIDVIVSSHDPQDADTKRQAFAQAAFGAVGLDTLLSAVLSVHHNDGLALVDVLKLLTISPAEILGLECGRLQPGAPADLILFDPECPWVLDESDIVSKCKNTPYEGRKLQGRVMETFVAGHSVYQYQD